MSDIIAPILAALIAAAASIIVCLLNNKAQQKKADIEQDKRIAEMEHKHELAMMAMKSEYEKSLMEVKSATAKIMAEMSAEIQQRIALLDVKFDELTKKVEKHNGLVERTYKLESDAKVVEEQIRATNNRIKNLEQK